MTAVRFAVPDTSVERVDLPTHAPAGNPLQLLIGVGCFVTCFAVFGTLSGMMPILSERLRLGAAEVGLLLALPILVGALLRIPLGIAADRFGGRAVLVGVLAVATLIALAMPMARRYSHLLACAVLLGVPLAVFSVGVAFVSAWYPPDRQGTALGLLGFGNVGHSLALFGAPRVVESYGYAWGFWAFALLAVACLIMVLTFAKDAPRRAPVRRPAEYLVPLGRQASWVLGLFYFLTFGGFLAMSAYLPKFLTLTYGLSRSDAGLRAAGFVLLATVMRPVGGYLSDRIGARTILFCSFPFVAVTALLMTGSSIVTFTAGALGMALALGLGNGAIFALVGDCFQGTVGTVTGLVGAAGALGGFFPPLVLGLAQQQTGSFSPAFAMLALFALACLLVCALGPRTFSAPADDDATP